MDVEAAPLPRGRPRGGQDLRHAQRGLAPQGARHRRGDRLGPGPTGGPRPTPRSATCRVSPGGTSIPRPASRRWTSTASWPGSPTGPRRRAGPHQRARVDTRQAVAGRPGLLDAGINVISTSTSSTSSRSTTSSSASPASPSRRPCPTGSCGRGPDRTRRHGTRGAPPSPGPRQRLPARAHRRRSRQLLPDRQPDRPARAGPAVGGRPCRRGAHDYRERHGIAGAWETKERVVVSLTGAPGAPCWSAGRRAWPCGPRPSWSGSRAHRRRPVRRAPDGLRRNRALLDDLGGRYVEVVGADVAPALVQVARAENATQLVLGATHRSRVAELPRLGHQFGDPRRGVP